MRTKSKMDFYGLSLKRGVTLLEILIAFIILSIAAIGAAGVISQGHKATKQDFKRGEALQILVDRMNHLSALPFRTLYEYSSETGDGEPVFATFKDKEYGNVNIGNNSYRVIGYLKRQSIKFDNLQELSFPNTNYVYNRPETWLFRNKGESSSQSFNSSYGDNRYGVIKILVEVQSLAKKNEPAGQNYQAMTFVCDME